MNGSARAHTHTQKIHKNARRPALMKRAEKLIKRETRTSVVYTKLACDFVVRNMRCRLCHCACIVKWFASLAAHKAPETVTFSWATDCGGAQTLGLRSADGCEHIGLRQRRIFSRLKSYLPVCL